MGRIDILMPVYHEGEAVRKVLTHLQDSVQGSYRLLVCYDEDDDPTLGVIRDFSPKFDMLTVKNRGRGVHDAIVSGFRKSVAPAAIVYPADDDVNGPILDELVRRFDEGCDIVAPSRFMRGGCMVGCRWTKASLVRSAAFLLRHAAGLPTHDPTNGFRLFSRRVIDEIRLESKEGFAFSIELLVKAHRRGWKVGEVPSQWFERKQGKSRFKILRWMPAYLRWFGYAFETRFGPLFWTLWLWGVLAAYFFHVILPKARTKG